MTLTLIHGRLANTAILFTAAVAAWALIRFIRRQPIDGSFWGGLAINELIIIAQGALGAFLFFGGAGAQLARPSIHILYGVSSLLVIPAMFVFTRGNEDRRVLLVYAAGLAFLVGILLRGTITAV